MTTAPNQMMLFVTLSTPDGTWIELNPAFIVYMERITSKLSQLPLTIVHLTTGNSLEVIQTPEEISDQQMAKMSELMETVFQQTISLVDTTFELE